MRAAVIASRHAAVGDRVEIVDDEGHGPVHGGDGGRQPRGDGDGRRGGHQRPEHGRVDRLDRFDPVDGHGDGGQQDCGVVVAIVGRDPTHARLLALGPLRQQRRLAVAGRGDDRDDGRGVLRGQAVDEERPDHDPRPGDRGMELRLRHVERKPGGRATRWRGGRARSVLGPRRHDRSLPGVASSTTGGDSSGGGRRRAGGRTGVHALLRQQAPLVEHVEQRERRAR